MLFGAGGTMPGERSWQSLSWPLKVIFATTFLTGILGLLWLEIGSWTASVSWILLGISIVAALMLLFPALADFWRNGPFSAGLGRIEAGLRSVATGTDLNAVAKQLDATGPICTKLDAIERKSAGLDRIEAGLRSVATGTDLNAVAKQLDATGPICTKLDAIERKFDGHLNDVEKQLERFSSLLDERTARLKAIKGQLGAGGDIEKGFKTIADAQDDAAKIKAGVASLQQAVDKLRENMSPIS
jgi:hypothetical protein